MIASAFLRLTTANIVSATVRDLIPSAELSKPLSADHQRPCSSIHCHTRQFPRPPPSAPRTSHSDLLFPALRSHLPDVYISRPGISLTSSSSPSSSPSSPSKAYTPTRPKTVKSSCRPQTYVLLSLRLTPTPVDFNYHPTLSSRSLARTHHSHH